MDVIDARDTTTPVSRASASANPWQIRMARLLTLENPHPPPLHFFAQLAFLRTARDESEAGIENNCRLSLGGRTKGPHTRSMAYD